MNDSLPDDLAAWPNDPYALLGVSNVTTQRQVRRRYAQLIRRFRPESHPDHFQRIRVAYEFVMAWAPEIEVTAAEPEAPPAEPEPVTAPEPITEPPAADEPPDSAAIPEHAVHDPIERARAPEVEPSAVIPEPEPVACVDTSHFNIDDAWDLACQGDTRTAYRVLMRLARQSRDSSEPALRLYWLLRLVPGLDSKAPVEWLLTGLASGGFSPRLLTTYVQELERAPQSVNMPGERRILDADAPPERLLTAFAARLRAATAAGHWDVIELDLSILRKRWCDADPSHWVIALANVCHRLGFSKHSEAAQIFNSCRAGLKLRETEALRHVINWERLTLLDALRELAKLRFLPDRERRYLPFIQATWNERDVQAEQTLLAELRGWRYRPREQLEALDALHAQCPPLFQAFTALVFNLRGVPPRETSSPDWMPIAHCLRLTYEPRANREYPNFRDTTAQVCATHLLSRDEVLQWLQCEPEPSALRDLIGPLDADIPLACYTHGVQAFAVRMGGGGVEDDAT